jgi:hypothetical protein
MSSSSTNHKSQCSSSPSSLPNLARLVPEVTAAIVSHLSNRDVKSLRLTCKILSERAPLHLDRVFLSANPRNIEVARAIADHETFRHGILEIIWDDALFVHDIPRPNEQILLLMDSSTPPRKERDPPRWFERACKENIENLKHRKVTKRDPDLSFSESWDYYQKLLEQQAEVLASGADADALRYALERFPSLRRIIITPAAYGKLDTPLYEMPVIRSFPEGFNYPIPHSWPFHDLGVGPYVVPPWNDETAKKQWRGFCIVTNELAKQKGHHVSELVIDVKELDTGLSCRVFDQPCEEYDNLVDLLRRPGFSRIDLALLADGQYYDDDWSSFRSGYLKQALGAAPDLLHVSFRIKADYGQIYPYFDEHCIPLRTIFPVDRWQKLQHFGLSNLLVRGPDLLSLLATLPTTLRSVELSFLKILGDRGNYRDLLIDMRDTLGWRDRAADERPRIIIHVYQSLVVRSVLLQYRCVDDQANLFLYDDAANPFGNKSGGNTPIPGMGVERIQHGLCYLG